jgi:lipoprotein signal peptidase
MASASICSAILNFIFVRIQGIAWGRFQGAASLRQSSAVQLGSMPPSVWQILRTAFQAE